MQRFIPWRVVLHPHAINSNWRGNVLQHLFANIVKRSRDLAAHFIVNFRGDADSARCRQGLEPRRNVDTVAIDIRVLTDDVAEIDSDTQEDSTATGKQWAKGPQYRSVGEVLTAAGVDLVKGGSFRLRHTFALRQLRRGKKPEEVARWMGIVNMAEMDRYARILSTPVDVV